MHQLLGKHLPLVLGDPQFGLGYQKNAFKMRHGDDDM